MYIMVKTYQNLQLFGPDFVQELSILESRKNNQANIAFSGGLQIKIYSTTDWSAPQSWQQHKRTSEILFIDKWYGQTGNKSLLREYGTEARGLDLSTILPIIVRAPIPGIRWNGPVEPKENDNEEFFIFVIISSK